LEVLELHADVELNSGSGILTAELTASVRASTSTTTDIQANLGQSISVRT